VIRHSEHLMGFTDREIELIAQVSRFHRKSQPTEDKHPEFAALAEADRARVRSMAGILRVAIGLDRNHDGAVAQLKVTEDDASVTLQPLPVESGADLTLERYSADHRSGLLAQQLGCAVVVADDC
jgi:exopolyphosphatase/guanosine-5'-triphosphate,3'-diphosphate pyrophosphatase